MEGNPGDGNAPVRRLTQALPKTVESHACAVVLHVIPHDHDHDHDHVRRTPRTSPAMASAPDAALGDQRHRGAGRGRTLEQSRRDDTRTTALHRKRCI
jgi:hypothetical protein